MKKAIDLYESFHKYPPRKIGKFPASFRIPEKATCVGEALEVLYRSKKYDPVTYRPPKRPIDYIHEHEGGVKCYRVDTADGRPAKIPKYIRSVNSLVRLGACLGFAYADFNGDEIEAVPRTPYPDLYAIPSGKALFVIQDQRKILAIIYGGRLGVEDRGIVY